MKKIVAGSLLSTALLCGSNNFELNVNNNTLELVTDIYLNNHYNMNHGSNYFISLSHLNTKLGENEPAQKLSSIGFKVTNPYVNNYGLSLGLGVKTVYTSTETQSLNAIPLSLFIKLELNQVLYFNLDGSFSPRVLTFADGENYRDVKFKVNYKMLNDGYIFLGARNIVASYNNNHDVNYDSSLFGGFQIKF